MAAVNRLGKAMKRICAVFILIAAAASASAQKVKVGADPAADFSKYKTYSWSDGMVAAKIAYRKNRRS